MAVVYLVAACGPASGQQAAADGAAAEMVTKVHSVVDLVLPAPNYPYEGTNLPGVGSARVVTPMGGGAAGGMGGGMGGMGMFNVDDALAQRGGGAAGAAQTPAAAGGSLPTSNWRPVAMRVDMDDLIEAITATVEPQSWDEVGGLGTITPIGALLAIRQTASIQAEVQSFLDTLRRDSGTLRNVSIDARWLSLNQVQLAQLLGGAEPGEQPAGVKTIDQQALTAISVEAQRYAGQITCFNRQTVHIISGQLETVLAGAIPVVGGNEVGYQPVIQKPHVGVLLQVTPSVLPGNDAVLLDLQSSVSRWDQPEAAVVLNSTDSERPVAQIDRVKMAAQVFATSLRMPLDRPVLVGGMSFPGTEAGMTQDQLYLVIEVRSSQEP
ncbi:MAG: hypothetical protein WD845_17160 [Pirellulales bacterium]